MSYRSLSAEYQTRLRNYQRKHDECRQSKKELHEIASLMGSTDEGDLENSFAKDAVLSDNVQPLSVESWLQGSSSAGEIASHPRILRDYPPSEKENQKFIKSLPMNDVWPVSKSKVVYQETARSTRSRRKDPGCKGCVTGGR